MNSSSSQTHQNSKPTISQQQEYKSLQSEIQPDMQQPDNSSEQSRMPSINEISQNTPEQRSCIKGKMPCLLSDDDCSMHKNEPLEKQLKRSKEKAFVYREKYNSKKTKIKKLKKIIHAMIEIDKKLVVKEEENEPEIDSDIEKLRKFRSLALEAEALFKKSNNASNKEAKNDKKDPEDNEEETESCEEETESSEEEAEATEEDTNDEDDDLKEAIRRSMLDVTESSSKMGYRSVEVGATASRYQFYNLNNQQWLNLSGFSENGSSSCRTHLAPDSVKSKSTVVDCEIMKLNENEAIKQRKRKRDTDWGSEEEMLSALISNPKMLLEAACALYRTEREMRGRGKVSIGHPTDSEFKTLTQIAIVLMEGNMFGPNKKSTEDLEKYTMGTGAFEFCAKLVGTYSTQLFRIYSRGWDKYFC